MQKLKELINLSYLYKFQLFASDIEGNISLRKFRNGGVAKKLMSLTFFVKFRVFEREFLRNRRYIGLKFLEKTIQRFYFISLIR